MASTASLKKINESLSVVEPAVLPAPNTKGLSAKLMKRLTGALVSTIAYSRNLFNEEDFCIKSLSGQNIRVIKGTPNNSKGVQCLSNWLQGAFDAMDHQYLKTLCLDIKNAENVILESYNFHYSYKDNLTFCSVEEGNTTEILEVNSPTYKDIQNALRNILIAISTLSRLPSNSTASVRIFYYDDVTPVEYEPPGFRPFTGEGSGQYDAMDKWTCGRVSTNFHTLTIKTLAAKIKSSSSQSDGSGIVCLCGIAGTERSGSLLKCETCGALQHMACYKIFPEGDSQSQRSHKCRKCSGAQPAKDFDAVACLFRRVIALCAKSKSISIGKLINELQISPSSALLNIRRLKREGALENCVEPFSLDKTDLMYTISKTLLTTLKPKYFY